MTITTITNTEIDLYSAVIRAIEDTDEKPVSRGDHVLIKPNLVIPASQDSGEITSSKLIEAVARYSLDCGASRVIIGEGPSYYQPVSRMTDCFTQTGVAAVAHRLGVDCILFDNYTYRIFQEFSENTPQEFRITEFAFECDKFINLPVLKTHWLTKVTLAMKNLKGCLKREDKPRFHDKDLDKAIVDLNRIVKPTMNVIDCTAKTIVHQLSRDYTDWKQVSGGLLIVGSDIVAVDTVGSALMGIDPATVNTITFGGLAGLGESDLSRIDIIGEELKRLKFKVKLPQEQLRQNFPLLEIVGAEKACSGCLIPLLSSLSVLVEQKKKLTNPLKIYLGKNTKLTDDKAFLLLGDCAHVDNVSASQLIGGCPLSRDNLLSAIMNFMSD